MKVNKIKISQLPEAETLKGFSTIGVDSDNRSCRADLGFVEEAAENANAAASSTYEAVRKAEEAAQSAGSAAKNADDAAIGANTAAQRAEDSVLELAQIGARVDVNSQDIADLQQQAVSKSDSVPLMNGTASAGSQNEYAAGDHRHPTDTTRAAVTYVDTELAKKQNTLTAGTNISISGNTISASAGSRIVYVSDFETLNPSSSLTDSVTGSTFTLAQGESCQFYAAYNANGKPWMGSGSPGSLANDALSSIYSWSGTITHIYSSYYVVAAYGANTTTGRPQMATRVYYGSSRYAWIISSDFSSQSTSGYLKLPSGIMVQWGYLSAQQEGTRMITFPLSFTSVYTMVAGLNDTGTAAGSAWCVIVRSLSTSNATTYSFGHLGVRWIAIGTWK